MKTELALFVNEHGVYMACKNCSHIINFYPFPTFCPYCGVEFENKTDKNYYYDKETNEYKEGETLFEIINEGYGEYYG